MTLPRETHEHEHPDTDDEDDEDFDAYLDGDDDVYDHLDDHDMEWVEAEREFHETDDDETDLEDEDDEDDDPAVREHLRQERLSRQAERTLDGNYESIMSLVEDQLAEIGFDRVVTYWKAKGFTVVPDSDIYLGGWSHGERGPRFFDKTIMLPESEPGFGGTTETESVAFGLVMLGIHESRSLDEIFAEIKDCKGLQALAHVEESQEQSGEP